MSLEKLLALDKNINVHYRLGIAYQTKGEKQSALAALQQFMSSIWAAARPATAKSRIEALKRQHKADWSFIAPTTIVITGQRRISTD